MSDFECFLSGSRKDVISREQAHLENGHQIDMSVF